MGNKALPLVSLEQAQKLKKLGFDWKPDRCGCIIKNELRFDCDNCEYRIDGCTRISLKWRIGVPTVALALKWFRDEKGVYNAVGVMNSCNRMLYTANQFLQLLTNNSCFNTYEEAETALLDMLIELELEKMEASDGD